ncbi:hypothetical protein OAI96_01515 [Pelagibacteraceae bacterium]|jgi:acyl carrier protein|nr:hypothetical protein [Pelagibacteraceae bacterium]
MISENKIFLTIADALEISHDKINLDSSSENIEKWDSLGQLAILSSLDELFDGAIADIPEIANSYSVRSLFDILKNNELI